MRIKKTNQTVGVTGTVANEYTEDSNAVYNAPHVNGMNNYSTYETFTGKHWIDGKPIYRKVVKIESPAQNSITNYAHQINNIDFAYIDKMFVVRNSDNATRMINVFGKSDTSVSQINKTNVTYIVPTNTWQWGYSDIKVYVVIEYTKTTD